MDKSIAIEEKVENLIAFLVDSGLNADQMLQEFGTEEATALLPSQQSPPHDHISHFSSSSSSSSSSSPPPQPSPSSQPSKHSPSPVRASISPSKVPSSSSPPSSSIAPSSNVTEQPNYSHTPTVSHSTSTVSHSSSSISRTPTVPYPSVSSHPSNIQPQIQYITQESSLPSTTKTSPTQTSGSSSSSSRPTIGVQDRPFTVLHNKLSTLKQRLKEKEKEVAVLRGDLLSKKAQYEDNSTKMTEKYKSDIKILQEKLKEKIKECNISASQHKEELGTISKRISILERQLADEQSLFETYKSQEKSRIHITLQKERDTFKKNETARRKRWVESKTKELRISIAQTYKDKIEEIVRDHKKELLAKDTKYAEEIFHLKEELKDQ
ncbi:hypothetical protein ADUPG1_010526, partial [Aduncisulcus paluster]